MKKIFLIISLFFMNFVSAEELDEVNLELNNYNTLEYKTFSPKIDDMKIQNKKNEEDYLFHPMDYVIKEGKEFFFNKEH